ncbi:hypothetical protein RB614_11520 [Phytohabitans sp. ZYX-F-186]|uniref:SpaA-like prealbumin fold domain-containing protein n=1 Tax=Phytohabitans maris TaxID=3071409 RepID=A0ABU0ZFF5_9ACTN|nr:hypothetical protein [Phytohabitans sp. ZYX-F-186]MDQ7905151.1 hypothetical protein [Phytohabitans sp. ZYX-F-186]
MAPLRDGVGHSRARRRAATRLLGRIGGALGILLPVVFAGLIATPTEVEAALPQECSPTTIFNLAGLPAGGSSGNAGNIYALDVNTGQNTMIGRFGSGNSTALNGLAVTDDLSAAYAVTQTNGTTIWTHTQAGVNSSVSAPSTGMTMVMGAVDPVTGIYYYAGYTGSGAGLTLAIFGYDPATNTPLGRLANVSMAGTGFSTGDIAFDGSGNLFVVAGTYNTVGTNTSQIRRVDGPLPTSGPAVTLPPTTLATNTAPVGSGFYNGIAFAADGTLFAQYATTGTATLVDINPNTGAVTTTTAQGGVASGIILTDLAGCSLPGTLTVQKDLPAGRAGADDQFTITITGGGITEGNSNTTTGTAAGIQDERVGPLPGIPSTEYTISESLAQGTTTSIDAYTTSWSCEDTNPGGGVVHCARSADARAGAG